MDGHLIGVRLAIDWQSFGIESVMDQHRLGIGLAALTTDWNEIGNELQPGRWGLAATGLCIGSRLVKDLH